MIVSASAILQRVICILCAGRLRLIHFLATIAFSSPPNDNLYKTRKLVAHQYCTTNRIYIALSSISDFQLLFRKKIGYSGPVGSEHSNFIIYFIISSSWKLYAKIRKYENLLFGEKVCYFDPLENYIQRFTSAQSFVSLYYLTSLYFYFLLYFP